MNKVTIPLANPTRYLEKDVVSITLREPSALEYLKFGEPVEGQRLASGAIVVVNNTDVIRGYITACIQDHEPGVLTQVRGVKDARAIRDGMLSFFSVPEASSSDSTISSSTSASIQPASADSD